MKITALIPAHNEEDQISKTISSLLSQTVPPTSIIVIADNCTDRTVEISRTFPVEVFSTVNNTSRKAGALNQGISRTSSDIIMILDADTTLASTFIEEGLSILSSDERIGAVGGVFKGSTPSGFLEHCQANEYVRYGEHIAVTGKTSVLTGTAALIRRDALVDVANNRGSILPGTRGEFYDSEAITEDSELTLALKTLGYILKSPVSMSCTTELMPTWGDLHRQRVRWYKGMMDNLYAYGCTKTTWKYFAQQAMLLTSTVVLSLLLILTVVCILTGTLQFSIFWLGIGSIFLVERIVTAWNSSYKGRLLSSLVFPELYYDLALQRAFISAGLLFIQKKQTSWNHVASTNISS